MFYLERKEKEIILNIPRGRCYSDPILEIIFTM